jgi:hypothetical protein
MVKVGTSVAVRGLLTSVAGKSVGMGVGPDGRLCGGAQATRNKIMNENNSIIFCIIFSYYLAGRV